MAHGPISQEVLFAKTESAYNTDPTPTAGANAILIRKVDFKPDKLRMVDRAAIRASIGTLQQIYAGALRSVSFEAEVKGSGAAGTAPELGPLLKACAMGETVVASTSVTYACASTAHSSVTLWWHESVGGAVVLHKMTGARGNVSFSFKAGDIVVAKFDMVGKYSTITDVAIPTPTYNSQIPLGIRGMSTTLGGISTLVIQNYELNLNNSLDVPDNLIDSEGFGNVIITKRDPVLMLSKHAEPVATINPWTQLSAGTSVAFASGLLGTVAGNRLALSLPQCHVRNVEPGEDSNFRTNSITLGAHENATDSDVSLAFT